MDYKGMPFVDLNAPPATPTRIEIGRLAARKGTVILCPVCRALIGTLAKDLFHGYTVAADSIQFTPAQHHDASEGAVCKQCGASYMKTITSLREGQRLAIHTGAGWV